MTQDLSGKAKGGIARAQNLTPEERKKIAKKAAEARWDKSLPEAKFGSADRPLTLGDADIPCYVLADGTRVLARIGFIKAIGRKGKAKGGRIYDDEFKIPVFLNAANLKPFISKALEENSKPIVFRANNTKVIGYKAELLPQVCEVFMDAREAGALRPNQLHIAEQCKILHRGFAKIGIIGLVDEATGFQEARDRAALQKILDKYLTDEWAKWTRTFPDDYYKHLFRLKNIPYPPGQGTQKPSYVGHWTNDIVYSRLAPGVLTELRTKNPRQPETGARKRKHHQHLTRDYGHPALKEHLSNTIFLMSGCTTWRDFRSRLNRARPKFGDTIEMDLD